MQTRCWTEGLMPTSDHADARSEVGSLSSNTRRSRVAGRMDSASWQFDNRCASPPAASGDVGRYLDRLVETVAAVRRLRGHPAPTSRPLVTATLAVAKCCDFQDLPTLKAATCDCSTRERTTK